MAAMIPSVMEALRLSGFLNTGTAFEIASVPVMAEHPPENALRTIHSRAAPCRVVTVLLGWTGSKLPPTQRTTPTTTSPPHRTMKAYVGTAKKRADSVTPRRFASATRMMIPTQIQIL